MIVFFAVIASVGAVSSLLRLVIAWADFRRRWKQPSTQVPTGTTVRLPAGGWLNRSGVDA
jgi:hypothetical protein